MAFQRRKSMDDTPARGGRGDRLPSIRDQIGMVDWPKKAKFLTVRLHPGVVPVGLHKYPLFRKDGSAVISDKSKKQVELDKVCLAFDMDAMDRDPDKACPYCEADMYFKIDYYAEGIVREEVENEPAKHKPTKDETKSGFKDFDNDNSWTGNRCFKLTANSYKRLKALKQLNKVMVGGEKTPMSVDHEEHGCDVNMNFDPDATGDGMYGMQRSDQCAITEEEQEMLHWDIEGAVVKATESEEEAQRNVDYYLKQANLAGEGEDEDFEEGDEVEIVDDDDDTHTGKITEIDDKKIIIEDEDGDERTFRRSKIESITKLSSKSKPKSKAKAGAKGKADDDDEDEAPRNKKQAPRKKPDPDDDDEDEAPRSKKPVGKKAKPEPDDDEEDEYTPSEGDLVIVTDGDDEETTGTVSDLTKKTIEITDEDDDEHVFKLAEVTIRLAPKPKAKAGAKKKPEPEPEEEEEEEYEPSEGDNVVVTDSDDEETTGTVTAINAKKIVIEDADEEEHSFVRSKVTVAPKPKGKVKPKPKAPAKGKGKGDDDDEEDEAPRNKKPAGKGGRSFDFDD